MTVVFQRATAVVAVLVAVTLGLSSCGNTIRGIGNDLGNAVDATQDAGRSVANSVR
ncbi:entericidin B signal peptide protein [Rhizobium sp. CRIBSB]|nr:entericidin B signal peptide protein [Rhizobium sp. CRIBSB]